MKDEPLISVIVPVYNVEKYLEQCIDSIISQTYQNLEIILVDDGSTDKSGCICDMYAKKDERIFAIHKQNEGVSSARNLGLSKAVGDYISFVDADDVIKEDYISYLYELLKEYNADISSCNYIKIYRESRERIFKYREDRIKTFTSKEAIRSMLYKKEVAGYAYLKLVKKKLIDGELFNEQLKLVEDFDFTFRILKKAEKIVAGSRVLYLYYQNPESCMHDGNWKKYEDAWEFLKEMAGQVEREAPSLITAYNTYLFIGGLGFYSKSIHWKGAEEFKCCLRKDIKQYSAMAMADKEGKRIYRILGGICEMNGWMGCELCKAFICLNMMLKIQLKKAI